MALPSMTVFAKSVAPSLTDLEAVILSICASDEDMLAIGSWEAPVKSLAVKGLLVKVGNGYRITETGRAAFDQYETDEMRGMVREHNARLAERDAPVIDGTAEECP